ncbi:MAG: serine hydrolase [Saprospiraceae bacterium]|nr:serine hydrolase [Saprospiraceae bacterium]
MKKQFALHLLALLLVTTAFSQKNILTESPKALADRLRELPQGFTPPTSAATLPETLDAVFDSITALTPIKGFNAAMLLPDGIYWKRASGLAEELPTAVPLTTEHLMGMGSISKPFVATTLLLLVEEGQCALDDSIGQYIGPYPNVAGSITIRQLLSHRSGLNDYLNENPASSEAWGNDPAHRWTFDEILNGYVLAPNFAPGTAWSYSNTNYLLAGVLIEALTGQPWYQVVRQKLIEPIGLTHTFVYPFETPGSQPFSHVFADLLGNGGVVDVQGFGFPDEGLFSLATSAGCLITTPEDLARFTERVFGGHLLQPATLLEMETDYVQDGSGALYGLGAAAFPAPENLENWGHNGDLIYKSIALYFPSENMSLAVQQNDDRSHDPTDPSSVAYDGNDVFLALLVAYLNYSPPSAAKEVENEHGLMLFPNPAWEQVFVKYRGSSGGEFAYIYNLQGRLIASQRIENQKLVGLDLSSLPTGGYIVRLGGQSAFLTKE